MEVLSQLEGPSNAEIRSNLCSFVADTLEQKLQKQNMDADNFSLSQECLSPAGITNSPVTMDPPNSVPTSSPTTVSRKDICFEYQQAENEPAVPTPSVPNSEHCHHFPNTHQLPHEKNSLINNGNIKNYATGATRTEIFQPLGSGFLEQSETFPNTDLNTVPKILTNGKANAVTDSPTDLHPVSYNPATAVRVQSNVHQTASDQGFPSTNGYFNTIPDYQQPFHSIVPQSHTTERQNPISQSFWQIESPNNATTAENENTNSMMSLLMDANPDPNGVFLGNIDPFGSGNKMFPIKPEPIRPVWNSATAM